MAINIAEYHSGSELVIFFSKTDTFSDFSPKREYPGYEGMKLLTAKGRQGQLGKVSNLIADMMVKGATEEEYVRVVKYSMVLMDAIKHKLDYKKAYADYGITELTKKYRTPKA